MTERLPDPLVPAEVDLRGYEYMPYYGDRLRDSDLNSRATDAEYRAAHNLWWAAWKQIPAASLPDDDVTLCKLADLGRDQKTWQQVKARAMQGFDLCSDGRYYHRVLSPIALDAWEDRLAASAKGKAGASMRWAKHKHKKKVQQPEEEEARAPETDGTGINCDAPAIGADSTGNATATKNDSKGEGKGKRKGKVVVTRDREVNTVGADALADWIPPDAWNAYVEMRKSSRKPLTEPGKRLAVRELERLKNAGQDPRAVLEQSVFRSWQGLFPIRDNGGGSIRDSLEERNRRATEGWKPPELRDET